MRRTVLTLLLPALLLAAACSSDDRSVVADGGGPVPGGGETALFVSIEVGGGFAPVGHDFRALPQAVVYDDGRTFSAGATTAIYPGPIVLPIVEGRLDDDELDRIVEAAADAGLLDGGALDVGDPPIADAATTTVTVVVDGETQVTSVEALGAEGGPGGEQPGVDPDQRAARQRVQGFVEVVSTLVTGAEEGFYEPDRYRVLPVEPAPVEEGIEAEELDWPLDDVELVRMECAVVAGDAAVELRAALEDASEITRWRTGDEVVNLVVRPLLPHEAGCPGEAGH